MTKKGNNEANSPFFVNRDIMAPTKDYVEWLTDLKKRYRKAQVRAAVKVNGEILRFYWSLGRDIMVKNADAKWGSGFLKGLSLDLQKSSLKVQDFRLEISSMPDSGILFIISNLQLGNPMLPNYPQW